MVRYKRRRKYKSRVVKMKFQSFVDIATQADNMQIISVSAGGLDVVKRLAPFFSAYKYYKLGGVSIKLIPASTLPVDPTGLSYAEDDFQTVDPRDQLTPGMMRITNGEDILEDITGLTGDQQRELYNNMLLDPRWFKWMLQTGVKRFGKPRYWQVGQLHQDKWPGAITNYPLFRNEGTVFLGTANAGAVINEGVGLSDMNSKAGSSPYGLFQTGHRGVLGWMPTDGLVNIRTDADTDTTKPLIASPVEVELFKILTPPMRKTNYYYRMFITETVYFKDPVVYNVNGYRPIDVFHLMNVPAPSVPTFENNAGTETTLDILTGGNDGSN